MLFLTFSVLLVANPKKLLYNTEENPIVMLYIYEVLHYY